MKEVVRVGFWMYFKVELTDLLVRVHRCSLPLQIHTPFSPIGWKSDLHRPHTWILLSFFGWVQTTGDWRAGGEQDQDGYSPGSFPATLQSGENYPSLLLGSNLP